MYDPFSDNPPDESDDPLDGLTICPSMRPGSRADRTPDGRVPARRRTGSRTTAPIRSPTSLHRPYRRPR